MASVSGWALRSWPSSLVAVANVPGAGAVSAGAADTSNAYPYVGRLEIRRDDGWRGFCSGTLIETRVVLTAAHCVRAVATGDVPPADIRVNFNPLASGATRAWEPLAYPAAGAALPAGFGEPHAPAGIHVLADPWNDIALLWLAEPAMGIDPAPMADLGYLDDPRVRNDTIAVVGYGLRGFDGSPATPVPGTHIPIRDPAGAGCLPRPLCHDQRRER